MSVYLQTLSRGRRWIDGGASALVRLSLLALLPALAGFAGDWFWAFDLCAHFRAQYAVALVIGFGAAIWARRHVAAIVLFAGLCANGYAWLGATGPQLASVALKPGSNIKLLLANIHLDNPDLEPLLRLIEREQPDLVAVLEFSPTAEKALATLDSRYPTAQRLVRDDPFGIGVWTRIDGASIELLPIGPRRFPTARLRWATSRVNSLWISHPFPPIGATGSAWRDAQLQALASGIANDNTAILMGDLNATPWSAAYRRLRRDASLFDTAAGRYPWPTWTAHGGLSSVLAIPIDHVLIGDAWRVVDRRVGPDIGSDHRPLIVVLAEVADAPARASAGAADP